MTMAITITFLVALLPEIILNVLGIVSSQIDISNMSNTVELSGIIYILLALKSSLGFFIYFATDAEFRKVILGYGPKLKNCLK